MADFEKIIPFIFHFAAGVSPRHFSLPLPLQFEIARKSGWSDDPDDPGGATMIDVTLKTYTAYRRRHHIYITTKTDLKKISFEEWKDILKTSYWNLWMADEICSQGLANLLVDWVWASGPKSIKTAQEVLGVKPDGRVGPATLKALNQKDYEEIFKRIHAARKRYYEGCKGAWKYLKGWLRRLDAIRADGTFNI